MEWADFHLLRPLWLLGLIPLAWLLWRIARINHGAQAWARVCDSQLLPHLLIGEGEARSHSPVALAALVGVLCVVAAAGPVWEKVPQPVYRAQLARVFVLDLSASMDTPDVRPSRLVRAKQKLVDMLTASSEGQTGLVVFAGSPHVVSPLTDDAATIASMVPTLSTDLMPLAGSRPELALAMAGQLLARGGVQNGQIILIGDDASGDAVDKAGGTLKAKGHRLSVLAVGTEMGAPLPLREGGFLKDQNGSIVVPRLETEPMRALANTGGGEFVELRPDDADVEHLMARSTFAPSVNTATEASRKTDLWREEGPWLLLAVLPLAALGFRRGWLGVCLLPFLTLGWQPPAQALEWDSMWLNQNQRAASLLEQGKPADAAALFTDPAWTATAQYRAGQFEAASKLYARATDDANAQYNLGNALAKLGRFDQAIKAYDRALAVDPGDADAKFNRDLLRKHQQEQDKKQSQSSQNDNNQPSQGEPPPGQQQQSDSNTAKGEGQGKNAKPSDRGDKADEATPKESGQQEKNGKQQPDKPQPNSPSQQQAQENGKAREGTPAEPSTGSSREADQRAELNQATEQWLRRIPDDPGGLLRRKFLMQLQQGQQEPKSGEKTW